MTATKKPPTHLRPSDLRALAQLATDATAGVARIAEGVTQSIWSTLGLPGGTLPGQTRGITGLVYSSVQGVTALVGSTVLKALDTLQPLFETIDSAAPGTPEREAVLAALNGVMGDRLAATHNPLATVLTLRYQGNPLTASTMPAKKAVTGKVLLLIHGLCMNDLQWRHTPADLAAEPIDHGQTLAKALGYTPVYVRYNSGLHTSQNAQLLSAQLAQLVTDWPVKVSALTIVAHSMGGLITRSALHTALQANLEWAALVKQVVFLGTPHHGAPLERAGNWVDIILGATPYSAPFAKLGQLRSAGITDLRYGHVLEVDWQGQDRFRRKPDSRALVPLPTSMACYSVAATTAGQRSALADRLIGDGLVPLNSALGVHDVASRTLSFAKANQMIAYRMNHMELLHRPEVSAQLLKWLA